jgi:hypothetical protein
MVFATGFCLSGHDPALFIHTSPMVTQLLCYVRSFRNEGLLVSSGDSGYL